MTTQTGTVMDLEDLHSHKETDRYSVFELGGKLFGLEVLDSREVIPIPGCTPLPNSNQVFLGVFNLRGDIYPLVDISPILGLPAKRIKPTDMVILVDNQSEYVVGVVVDNIHSIQNHAAGDIKMSRGAIPRSLSRYVRGIIQDHTNVIHLLDLDALYKTREIRAHF